MTKLKYIKIILMTLIFSLAIPINTFASNTSAVTKPLDNLKVLLAAIVASIGGIILVWGIYLLGTGIRASDTSSQHQGWLSIASGGVMASAGTVIAIIMS
jgi:hypothetical protein